MRRAIAVVLAACAVVGPAPARASTPPTHPPAAAAAPAPDRLFPNLGSRDIDVQHYGVDLTFDQASRRLSGRVTVTVLARMRLDTIVLDSDGPQITAVSVDGQSARYSGGGGKLRIAPATAVAAGTTVDVAIDYFVDTRRIQAIPGVGPSSTGWFNSTSGSYVLNEPDGGHRWLPSNDHPSDKATWTFRLTVGAGLAAVANGTLASHVTTPTGEVWTWEQSHPMATYLIQLLTGHYTVSDGGTTPSGVRLVNVAVNTATADMGVCASETRRQIEFFEGLFGAYPFATYGIAVTDSFPGLAMETQGRSTFSSADLTNCQASGLVLSHELAHQWFGDSVTLADWGDIWLNESFATYGQWLWSQHADGLALEQHAAESLIRRGATPTGSPSVSEMFGINSYDGGAVVLHALRRTIGDEAFFTVLRRWVQGNRYGSGRTADFIALAEQVSGRSLVTFFDTWLYAAEVPSRFPDPVVSPTSEPVEQPAAPASWLVRSGLGPVDAGR